MTTSIEGALFVEMRRDGQLSQLRLLVAGMRGVAVIGADVDTPAFENTVEAVLSRLCLPMILKLGLGAMLCTRFRARLTALWPPIAQKPSRRLARTYPA